jgi:transposase
MPGVLRAAAAPSLVPVRVVEAAPSEQGPRPGSPPRKPAERPGEAATTIEVVLANGRVLRVSEAIRPEALGRLAAALEG